MCSVFSTANIYVGPVSLIECICFFNSVQFLFSAGHITSHTENTHRRFFIFLPISNGRYVRSIVQCKISRSKKIKKKSNFCERERANVRTKRKKRKKKYGKKRHQTTTTKKKERKKKKTSPIRRAWESYANNGVCCARTLSRPNCHCVLCAVCCLEI